MELGWEEKDGIEYRCRSCGCEITLAEYRTLEWCLQCQAKHRPQSLVIPSVIPDWMTDGVRRSA